MTGPDSTRTYPIGAPRTRQSSRRGNFTNPHFTFPVHKHSFIHSHTSKHRICNYCIKMLRIMSRSVSRLIQHERRPAGVRRPAHEGLEATLRRTEVGEKMQMSRNGLCLTHSKADRVISTFSFDPNLKPCPQNLHRGEASRPPETVSGMTQAST